MNKLIKFSILVPVYNVEEYIDECIQSVLAQTYTNYELILVDDGSSDNSGKIIDQYANQYANIKAYHKENRGQFHTRRYAISHASGDYYVMLDSDDLLEKNCLEVLLQTIIRYNCDCVFYNRKKLIEGKIVGATYHIKEEYIDNNDGVLRKALIEVPYNAVWLKCGKASLYTGNNYTQYYHIRKGEDALQSLELVSNCNTAAFIDDELYIYRQRAGSICNPINQVEYKVDLTVREICLDYILAHRCFSEEDINRHRDRFILFYIDQIILVGSLNMSYQKKKIAFQQLRTEKYFTDFLSKGLTHKNVVGHKIIIWYLFKLKLDNLIILIISIYKFFANYT